MKKGMIVISLLVISIIINFGCEKDEIDGLPFTTKGGYYINPYPIDSNGSFLTFQDMDSFDMVFGIAYSPKAKYIKAADFEQNFVIAVLKDNGFNSYELKIKKIDLDTLDQQVINVDYNYILNQPNISWSSRAYSIVMLAKIDHHTIRFFENGILVKELGD